jgi:hypothetical protein
MGETSCQVPNRLSATNAQIKKCIFQSFLLLWQHHYICSGKCVANTPLSDIIKFMSNKKLFADSTKNLACALDKKEPLTSKDDTAQGSFKKRKHDKGKRANVPYKRNKEFHSLKPDLECPIDGGHPQNKCFNNPQGKSYKPHNGHHPTSGGCG